ncbi:MAG: hypothetical protein KF886_03165 [Candidatus Hydrogenedentes bacterium]|nr:hypothetical protein [Candidatus Hydrogenedentota bacterium]
MRSQLDDERTKLERLRADVQKGIEDLENGRHTEIISEEGLDALFVALRRRSVALRKREADLHDWKQVHETIRGQYK